MLPKCLIFVVVCDNPDEPHGPPWSPECLVTCIPSENPVDEARPGDVPAT